jgi:hypothetical protein
MIGTQLAMKKLDMEWTTSAMKKLNYGLSENVVFVTK